MSFKSFINQRREESNEAAKPEHSPYTYSHTTKHLTLLRRSKRSQSALEYMMTYGWAILIIVIVAVILYSMGIFNPSSSISTTITGFSSTPVSSALFTNNGGLSISVQNSVGYPIEITNITATTPTGGKVTIQPNITLLSGKSQVFVLSKVFTASSQNSHISTAVTITYKEVSQPLPGPYISTGSITGSTPAVIYPSNYTFAAVSKLTIKNSQSTATPNPFQQMVNITSADNGWQLISPDFGQNVEFFYANGTVIPSWLESYTGSNAIWWLKLGSIPASSSITVYMGIAPTSTNLFNNVNDGEAPQLSSTYAEYDDGAKIFNYYVNFNGTSLPSNWGYSLGGGSCTQDNGIICTANFASTGNNCAFVQYVYNLSNLGTTEAFDWGSGPFTQNIDPLYIQEGGGPYCTPGPGDFNLLGTFGSTKLWTGGIYSINDNVHYPSFSGFLGATDHFVYQFNYNTINITANAVPSSYFGKNYFAVGDINDSSTPKFYWFDIRNLPPNDIMPSVTFGSVA